MIHLRVPNVIVRLGLAIPTAAALPSPQPLILLLYRLAVILRDIVIKGIVALIRTVQVTPVRARPVAAHDPPGRNALGRGKGVTCPLAS
jgi:hypothetical protein